MKTWTLELRNPDGQTAWSRDVADEHVKIVAEFLQNNLGLIIAARGVVDTARGVQAIMQGLDATTKQKRVKGKR